jgi:hypothetical protein
MFYLFLLPLWDIRMSASVPRVIVYSCEVHGVVISMHVVCRSLHTLSVHWHVRGKQTATALQSVPLHNMQAPVEFPTISVTPTYGATVAAPTPCSTFIICDYSLQQLLWWRGHFCWWQDMRFCVIMLADSDTKMARAGWKVCCGCEYERR